MVGGFVTVKALLLVAVPSGVVTLTGPVVAPAGTAAEICVAEFTVKVAVVPLNFTEVAPVKFVPLIVTLVPTVPLVGEKLVIVGGSVMESRLLLVALATLVFVDGLV